MSPQSDLFEAPESIPVVARWDIYGPETGILLGNVRREDSGWRSHSNHTDEYRKKGSPLMRTRTDAIDWVIQKWEAATATVTEVPAEKEEMPF